jgi:hypothetical protein
MRRLRIRICQPPLENPRDKLVRLAMAIDDHFDEGRATEAQRTDLINLNIVMQAVKEAQEAGRPKLVINVKVGLATGLCERYIRLYQVPVPDAPISA